MNRTLFYASLMTLAWCMPANAAQCTTPFTLSGSAMLNLWSQVTNNAWSGLLPKGWVDNGFHFYSQIRQRGPDAGINTPSDLESEIMKKVADQPEGSTPIRQQILLPIKNSAGKNLRVIYDYDGKASSKCQLVTLSY